MEVNFRNALKMQTRLTMSAFPSRPYVGASPLPVRYGARQSTDKPNIDHYIALWKTHIHRYPLAGSLQTTGFSTALLGSLEAFWGTLSSNTDTILIGAVVTVVGLTAASLGLLGEKMTDAKELTKVMQPLAEQRGISLLNYSLQVCKAYKTAMRTSGLSKTVFEKGWSMVINRMDSDEPLEILLQFQEEHQKTGISWTNFCKNKPEWKQESA
jgi:hypothetical protein